jgi:Domain of unknown function (DUF4082)/Fibronectin type III domain/Mo-co oxidoreductase dimerisation domain
VAAGAATSLAGAHDGRLRLRPVLLSIALLLVAVSAPAFAPARALAACSNPVACENQLPGDPKSDWEVNGVGDPSIQGYATSMSVNVGQTESFKINTPSTAYHIDILRLGYYGGDGARKVASDIQPTATLPQTQPSCLTDSSTGLIDCGNWSVSASWTVPADAVSGVYIAHLVRDDSADPGGDSQIPFVVRNDASHSDILVATSDATWEAYNDYGGNSLYTCTVACPPGNPLAYKAAYAVSYNRPFDGSFATDGGSSYLWYAEYQMIEFLEQNGYDVSYTADPNVDASGSLLLNHKVFLTSGHDEYWSAGERANVEAARDAGVNLAFFTGNEIFWKTRWAASSDGSSTPYRTLITYKETHFNAVVDPSDPPTWTGAWSDPRFSPPADGGDPANALSGQEFDINAGTADIQVPSQYSKLRIWRNTAVANLSPGQTLTLAPGTGTLGYEWDYDEDNGFRPPGEFDLSSTTVSGLQAFTDYGSTTTGSTATGTHHLTLYRAPGGALVFGAGTVQWSWGLNNTNAWSASLTDPSGNPPDPNMQQATVNLLADMGAQPSTLISGLSSATESTDTTPPTSTITSPAANATFADGSSVAVSGTATDAGGGVVAGVEVSTDGGSSWHPATITTPDATTVSWTYSWSAHGAPTATIKSRAVDDSGNLETPSPGVTVNVNCPCSIWGSKVTPTDTDGGDGNSIEVGVQFRSDTYGEVTGVSFYKASTNTGTHVGGLYASNGTLLASANFANETASGWQTITFASPVFINPNTTYVAAYFAPEGHYSDDANYFYSPGPVGGHAIDSPPLHALLANGLTGNGVYSYSPTPTFPTSSFSGSNYWVDVSFAPVGPAGQVTNVTATAGQNSAAISWSAPTSGGSPTQYTITPFIGSTAQTPTTITGTPPATNATITGLTQGTSYTFTVQASNPAGAGTTSSPSNAVTPTGSTPPTAPQNVTASGATSQALINWTAPTSNGGSPITGYTITPYIGSTAQTTTPAGASATSATVTGLTNGTAYTFTVKATNSIGTSPESTPSSSATPINTIFDFSTPATIDSGDPSGVELGVKFTSDTGGSVTGIRFYKAATSTGSHVGSLWTSTGTLLASATFTGETASGWQQVNFSTPVAITAGTTYVAGYFAPNGHYSDTASGLSTAVNNPPLHALANGTSPDGVYAYAGTSTFPSSTFGSSNYWVDVMLTPPSAPGQVTGATATAGAGSATVSWSAPTTGGSPTQYTITPFIGSTAQTPTTITGTPPATSTTIPGLTNGTAYTFTVQASNPAGAGTTSSPSNAVTPTGGTAPTAPQNVTASGATSRALVSWTAPTSNGGSPITGYTITPYIGSTAQATTAAAASATSATVTGLTNGTAYTFTVKATNSIGTSPESTPSSSATPINTIFDFSTPATIDSGDTSSVELGVKFTSDSAGLVTGIRFYKAATNTGTHIGSLWTSTGTLLASATFTGETASGWQQVNFSTPVAIIAGTTYVAGYLDPNGHYSVTGSGLTSAVNNAPLHAVANTTSPNGVYVYGSSSAFPSSSFNASNYFVDVMLAPPNPPGQVTGVTATAGQVSASVSWSAPTTGGSPTQYTVTPFIGSTAQTPTTITGTPPATSTTITGLTGGTSYTFKVQASNASGAGTTSAASNAVTPTGSSPPTAPQNVVASGATSQALVSWTAPTSNGGSPITGYTITPYIGSTAQATTAAAASATSATVTGLTNGTAYTFTVKATNSVGTSPESTHSAAATPINTIFDFATPATLDSGDAQSVELGVKFNSDTAGHITGIRFYKATANSGTHIGSLWTSTGTLLASATFTGESASGWQQVNFSTPVAITAGTTYIAGYLDPKGHYSDTASGLTAAVNNVPLHTIANATSANGVYVYTSTSTFPVNTFNASNYWVDVMFTTP